MIYGGGQERGMRSGTLNVPGIVGLGKACELSGEEMRREAVRLTELRRRLRDGLVAQIDDLHLNGPWERRLPGNLHMSIAHVEGESLLMGLRDVALSSGSACTSATLEPSHVLRAIGVRDELAHNSLRFGLGRFNTETDVDYVVERVSEEVRRLRALSPMARARETRAV
jgi:cysteine desulfurase